MKRFFSGAVVFILPLVLIGCKDENRNPTKDTFKKALYDYITENKIAPPACVTFLSPMTRQNDEILLDDTEDISSFMGLKKLGYLNVKENLPDGKHDTKYLTLNVTPKYLSDLGEPRASMSLFGIDTPAHITKCYGHFEFEDVTDFTKPSDESGQMTSVVDYTMLPVWDKGAEWLKEPELQRVLAVQPATSPVNQKIKMVLKDSGWSIAGN